MLPLGCTRTAICSQPYQAHVLSSIVTADLRDELIHHRWGEDRCITIERHCERRHNIEGRNLERYFESLAPAREVTAARAMRPLTLQWALGGVWHLHHIFGWWFGHTNFDPTYWRSMTRLSTPPNSCRITPPPSLLQEEMRSSWPTISRLP
jgi:hypothetical protein